MNHGARARSLAAIDRFAAACADHPLVVAAFLGGSYAAGTARDDSDIDVYLVTREADYPLFVAERGPFMASWGRVTWAEEVWDFEGLGFDMICFRHEDGVHGEVALGHTANFMQLHGGPHRTLVDEADLLDGVSFPLLQ
ncbi:MAG TPA: nucleotidyltransferase domain-containing protein [Gaiellales bacterium]|nr:nucleotidyltransferase domain-containing protein [Gaiellales bacterium]